MDKFANFLGDERTKPVKVILTIAHLDQDPTNNKRSNLKALCQLCHNRLDAPHRAKNRKANKIKDQEKAGQMTLGFRNE